MTTAGRRFGILGAATAALGAAIAGSVSNLVMDETTSVKPRRQNGVTWGRGRVIVGAAKKAKRQLTNDERKQLRLPHDGAKQAEKDRRRGLRNEIGFQQTPKDVLLPYGERRASPIVCRGV